MNDREAQQFSHYTKEVSSMEQTVINRRELDEHEEDMSKLGTVDRKKKKQVAKKGISITG